MPFDPVGFETSTMYDTQTFRKKKDTTKGKNDWKLTRGNTRSVAVKEESCTMSQFWCGSPQVLTFGWREDIRVGDPMHTRKVCFDAVSHNSPVTLYDCHGMKGNQLWRYRKVGGGAKCRSHSVSNVLKSCPCPVFLFSICFVLSLVFSSFIGNLFRKVVLENSLSQFGPYFAKGWQSLIYMNILYIQCWLKPITMR